MSPEFSEKLQNAISQLQNAQKTLDAIGLSWSSTKLSEVLDTIAVETRERDNTSGGNASH